MKIALMGSAPSSVRLGPYMDRSWSAYTQGKPQHYPPSQHIEEEWDIWGCSPGLFGAAPRATRWFELHRWEPGQTWFSPEYCQFLREFAGPVYTGGAIPEIRNHVVYPLPAVEAQFSAFFLNSSLSLMAALAIFDIETIRATRSAFRASAKTPQEFIASGGTPGGNYIPLSQWERELPKDDADDVIGFWGVDMSANEEYSRQKPGCWFFMLEIVRRGIGLFYPPESDLGCPEPVYGISEWDHDYIKATARAREFHVRAEEAQQKVQQGQAELAALHGARDDLNYWIKTFMSPYRLPAGEVLRIQPGTGLGVTQPSVAPSGAQPAAMTPYTGKVSSS